MNSASDIKTLIRAQEDQRYEAILEGKFDTFAHFAHPDLQYAHSNGVVDTVDSYLKKCRDGFYVYHHIEHPIDSIRIEGNIALVFGEMNAEITSGGVRKTLRNKALAVWISDGAKWQLLAYQPTPIA
ncbi:nuclear transport factor 2 family protein [Pseudomonas protegens]|uniref:nuclear transport factor 2 family protein n=1 Tax=Pseudomonas protegens TaxID=380021 RepID=UPI001C698AAC|nr:nuclear transport factor 2 family protein [Pseudomonas protegens]QYN03619.1 nuclear transport factor 2 family protein [Pseudomonas protegens]